MSSLRAMRSRPGADASPILSALPHRHRLSHRTRAAFGMPARCQGVCAAGVGGWEGTVCAAAGAVCAASLRYPVAVMVCHER